MSFKGDLEFFAAKAQANIEAVTKKVLIDIGKRVVERTPVGDPTLWQSKPPPGYAGGRARGSWQYGFNVPNAEQTDSIDPTGSTTNARIAGDIKPIAGLHYITSSLAYMPALENGHSTQAPQGMVGLTAIEFSGIVDIAVRDTTK
jgi:hypothetical protein